MSYNFRTIVERTLGFTVLLFIAAVSMALLLPPVTRGRTQARQSQCRSNLKQIGIALHNYHDIFGSFPPAYIPDEYGHPKHSWRTLILAQLDQAPLYNSYRFDESWDGPHNSGLRGTNLPVFSCPSDGVSRPGKTSYVAVVGPHTAWPGGQPSSLTGGFPKGTANTILVVEIADSGIDWIEPRDLNFDEISFQLNGAAGNSISSAHKSKGEWPWSQTTHIVHVLFADGHVERLPHDTPPEKIRAMLMMSDGEEPD